MTNADNDPPRTAESWEQGLRTNAPRPHDALWESAARAAPARHPEVQRAAGGVEQLFGDKLAVCKQLRDFALETARPWGGRPLDGQADLMPRASMRAQATRTGRLLNYAALALLLKQKCWSDRCSRTWWTHTG
jgi:hypothetical protein